MKALARGFVWWPMLDKDILEITRACTACIQTKKNPFKIPLIPWAWPTMPWHRIHADFLGPIDTKMILLIIDSHSKCPEAYIMKTIGEEETLQVFDDLFSRCGFPLHLVTDNFKSFVGSSCNKT